MRSSLPILALLLLAVPLPVLAQAPFAPTALSDADALAEQVRRLGANPVDLEALLTAGELSIRMEDLSAAGAFFARAERIDPRNGRAKAGEGAMLVQSQRPAESLRYFTQAEQLGLAPARFAADRGLAYDLLGDAGRAQRDYRAALALRDEPETRRRYALSLGIVGRQAQALDVLTPLIRQNDRAAWRSRAFVLAMGGEAAEATRIAQTMMPPGAAAGLQAFFAQLPRMAVIDRAFAVHFGEVQATPQRLADARLAPREAPLALEPLPVQAQAARPAANDRRSRRDRRRREEVAVAVAPPPPPLPEIPTYQAPLAPTPAATTSLRDRPLSTGELASLSAAGNRVRANRSARPGPAGTAPVVTRALTAAEQASLAAATGRAAPPVRPVVIARAPLPAASVPTAVAAEPTRPVMIASAPPPVAPVAPAVVPAAPSASLTADTPPTPPASVASPLTAPVVARALSAAEQASLVAATGPAPVPAPAVQTPQPGFATAMVAAAPPVPAQIAPLPTPPVPLAADRSVPAVQVAEQPVAALPPARPAPASSRVVRRQRLAESDAVLSRIIAGLAIPATELDVAPARVDRAAAARKAAADKKALAERKAAADKKAVAEREAAAEQRAARAEPARIWVQVAGGANQAGLGAAWRTMAAKAPAVLNGRQAWTTPLRATNRVLAGPFKTDAEARALVKQLGKQGVQAFTFSSETGQKITRLSTK